MIPTVLAVAAFYRRAWTIAVLAGLLALVAMYVATEPRTTPAHVVHQEYP